MRDKINRKGGRKMVEVREYGNGVIVLVQDGVSITWGQIRRESGTWEATHPSALYWCLVGLLKGKDHLRDWEVDWPQVIDCQDYYAWTLTTEDDFLKLNGRDTRLLAEYHVCKDRYK